MTLTYFCNKNWEGKNIKETKKSFEKKGEDISSKRGNVETKQNMFMSSLRLKECEKGRKKAFAIKDICHFGILFGF